jgi:hypothetical protein
MRSLTRDQFLKIFGINSDALDAQQRAGYVALAFGTPIRAMPGRYLDLDLVAMAIAEEEEAPRRRQRNAMQKKIGPPDRLVQRSNQVTWRVGKVHEIDVGAGFIPSPGFTIQQDGQPPALTITFEDLKPAEQCASSMREIIDKATAIRGRD